MIKAIHPAARVIALLTIATFWLSTALSALFRVEVTVAAVTATVAVVLLPVALQIEALAKAVGAGTTSQEAIASAEARGYVFGDANILPTLLVMDVASVLPGLRQERKQDQSNKS